MLAWIRGIFRRGAKEGSGRVAERIAARLLRAKGYRILHRNLVIGDDEADLVAIDPSGESLVIVEVKSRQAGPTAPEESVGSWKRHRLSRLASRLLARSEHQGKRIRFDVVGVEFDEKDRSTIRHHVAAFECGW